MMHVLYLFYSNLIIQKIPSQRVVLKCKSTKTLFSAAKYRDIFKDIVNRIAVVKHEDVSIDYILYFSSMVSFPSYRACLYFVTECFC